jgi:phage shock protein C
MPEEEQTENPSEEKLFDRMANLPADQHSKKLQRSKSNVVLAGVCSGIADYLKMNVANIRLIALLSILLGGWSVVAYLITALLLPVENFSAKLTNEERSALQKENFRTVLSGLFIFTGLHFTFIYMGIGSSESLFILPNGFVFPIVAITAGIFFLTKNNNFYAESDHVGIDIFFRSRVDRMIMGVCGGLGKYLNVDSSALRIIFILATFLTVGMFVVVYLFFSVFAHLEPE